MLSTHQPEVFGGAIDPWFGRRREESSNWWAGREPRGSGDGKRQSEGGALGRGQSRGRKRWSKGGASEVAEWGRSLGWSRDGALTEKNKSTCVQDGNR